MTVAFNVDVFYTGCMNMPVPLTPAGVSLARRGHKKETTCGFLILVNLPLSLRGHGENRRDETAPKRGTAEDFFFRRGAQCAPMPKPIRSAGYRSATHMGYSTQARHDRAAQPFGTLYRMAPTDQAFGTIYPRRCCLS